MRLSRRHFIRQSGLCLAAASVGSRGAVAQDVPPLFRDGKVKRIDSKDRVFHLSVKCTEVLQKDEHGEPLLPPLWKEAGITDLWFAPWVGGRWRYDDEMLQQSIRVAHDFGMDVHFLTVPFGHPASEPNQWQKAANWRPAIRPSGQTRWGVSCHAPVDRLCVETVRKLADTYGPCDLFLDDDYRFANQPDDIGGCICSECKADFQKKTGYTDAQWNEMIQLVREKRDTPQVRLWVDYFCDRLTKLFRETAARSPEVDLGIMVMGMGSERAGVRLDDYRGHLFRVGEWMFTNERYDSTKNKTIELYSSLFHRRFVSPGRAFSETTMLQPLSAENFASKLVISTLSDVRNTMFMCPIPADYWKTITPRARQEARFHHRLLGVKARGPFKHFWGMADRYMYGYNAYSLALALGVPFEVCDEIPRDGWTFLGDASANEMERGELKTPGSHCVARFGSASDRFTGIPETFEDLFRFRRSLLPDFRSKGIPYIEEETPMVLGWYPDARACLLWNLESTAKTIHLCQGEKRVGLEIGPLDSVLVEG